MNTKSQKPESPEVDPNCYAVRNGAPEFGPQHDDPEGLHAQYKSVNAHYALTATQYFGFHVPEHRIHACLVLWHHPNLGLISGGPMVWQGIKKTHLACELYDQRNFMPDTVLGDLKSYTMDSSYQVDVIDGGKSFRNRYSDPSRQNHYDVTQTPVSERIYWPSGKHFEQVMRTRGELVLRGKCYEVNGFHVRDRSWGENRLEVPIAAAPIAWSTGVFNEGFAFNVTGSDDPARHPVWSGKYPMESKDALKFGWIIVDGEPVTVARMSKLTTFEDNLFPKTVAMQIEDTRGRTFDIKGSIRALSPHYPQPNWLVHICLTRWECNGLVGWGDHQEVQWTDFLQGQSVA